MEHSILKSPLGSSCKKHFITAVKVTTVAGAVALTVTNCAVKAQACKDFWNDADAVAEAKREHEATGKPYTTEYITPITGFTAPHQCRPQ